MIGIVILNYNEWKLTIDCIKSINKTYGNNCRIYIVDNASQTNRPEDFNIFLEENAHVQFLKSDINRGYAGGNNIGINAAIKDSCNYILVTNNDVIFHDDSIDTLQDYLAGHPDVGIVGPRVYLPNGELQEINMVCKMDFKGKYLYLLRKTPLKRFSSKFVKSFHGEDLSHAAPFVVFAVSGCCFMMTKEAYDAVCPLDEGTFLYEEENIIGCRMERAGLKTVYCTDSIITHLGGGSTTRMSEFSYICFVNSELYYIKKYLQKGFWASLPIYLFREIIFIKTYGVRKIGTFHRMTRERLLQGKI